MTFRARFTVLAVFLFANCAFSAESPSNTDDKAASAARVVFINGEAKLKERRLAVGELVQIGDWIKTSPGAGVKLLMPDRSIIDIGPSSQFRVQGATQNSTDGQLEWGSVRASIQKKLENKIRFRVRTKSSVLSARGTEFAVSSFPKPGTKNAFVDQVTVKSGKVEMEAPGLQNLMLDAGKQVTAQVNTTPQGFQIEPKSFRPVEIPKEAMQKTMAVATISDDTFRQVVVVPSSSSDRGPKSEGTPPPVAGGPHLGQDALAGANLKAANDPEGGKPPMPPPMPQFQNSKLPPRDPNIIGGLNKVGGSNAETKLNEGVNVTVVFQL